MRVFVYEISSRFVLHPIKLCAELQVYARNSLSFCHDLWVHAVPVTVHDGGPVNAWWAADEEERALRTVSTKRPPGVHSTVWMALAPQIEGTSDRSI